MGKTWEQHNLIQRLREIGIALFSSRSRSSSRVTGLFLAHFLVHFLRAGCKFWNYVGGS